MNGSACRDGYDVWFHVVWLAASLAVLLAAAVLRVPSDEKVEVASLGLALPEMCMFRRTTGLQCPGCGLTRSVVSTVRGDIRSAFQFNVAGPLVFALIAFQLPYRSWQLWRLRTGRKPFWLPGGIICLWFLAALVMVQFAVRLVFR